MTSDRPRRRPVSFAARVALVGLGVLYTLAVAWVTLRPLPWATAGNEARFGILNPHAWTDSAAWLGGSMTEVVLNVMMFVPIGLVTGLLMRGVASLLLPVALTLVIELAQIPLERISHPRDLLANALGAAAGVAFVAVARRRRSGTA